jgi:hypothetical protein
VAAKHDDVEAWDQRDARDSGDGLGKGHAIEEAKGVRRRL